MYEAIVSAKLLYALEATPIPKNYYEKIDAAFFKGIRQILNIKTTYGQMQSGENRTNTKEYIIQRLIRELSKQNKTEIIQVTERKNQRQSDQTTRENYKEKPR